MAAVVQSASFQQEMAIDKLKTGDVLAAFFFAYALGQMPAGWLADRFGPRRMLVAYIALWSLCTAFTGFVTGLIALVIVRCACGLAEAGAYPSSGLLISRWFPFTHRARANGVVAFGGRVGNSMALWLTAGAIAALGSWRPVLWTYGAIGRRLVVRHADPEIRAMLGTAAAIPDRQRGVCCGLLIVPAVRQPCSGGRGLWRGGLRIR